MLRSHKLCLILLLCALFSRAQITSTFDTNADGWTVVQNGSTVVTHALTGGNPGGFVSASDLETGFAAPVYWYWNAPAKFIGNKIFSYGFALDFSLQQNIAGTTPTESLVRISNGTTTLYYFPATSPALAPAWSNYSITLNETGGNWKTSNSTTGTAATKSQIQQVLLNITVLQIRGEFNGPGNVTPDVGGLDQISMGTRAIGPSPIITSFTPALGNVGTVVTITGNFFDPTPNNNAVYFGPVSATVSTASVTQLSVVVPAGATLGRITVTNKTSGFTKTSTQSFTPTFPDGGRIIPASFENRFEINLAIPVEGFAIGDLDGDGWIDFAVANNESDAVDIYRNLGLGGNLSASSFAAPVRLTVTGSSTNGAGLQIHDLDGDGKLDVITSTGTSAFASAFATYRNISTSGNLSFEAQENWPGNSDETPISFVGDLDGDGRPEMIGGEGSSGAGANMWIAQNISAPGNVEFAASQNYFTATVDAFNHVSSADLDGDSKPELLVSHGFGDRFSIIKNNSTPGNLVLSDLGQISTGQYNYGLQATDFNGDGKNDIVYKRSVDDIHIRINTNSGGALALTDFTSDVILASDLANYGGMNLGDINGDGKPDIVATDDGSVGIFENVLTGTSVSANSFVPAYLFPGTGGSTYPTSPIAADFNGDGKPEIIMGVTNATPNRIAIFQNKNIHSPVISLTTVSPLKGPVGSTVTITGDYFSLNPLENTVKFGAVQATVISATRTSLTVEVPAGASYDPVSVTRGELTSRYHLPFTVIFSPGAAINAASFSPPVNFTLTGADYDIDAGDMNGDNKVDLLVEGNSAGFSAFSFRNTHVTGAITTSSLMPDDTTSSQNPKLIDLDGDSKPDIAGSSGVYRNASVGSEIGFQSNVTVGATINIGVADFNLDGKMDYAGANGSIQIYENRTRTGAFLAGTYPSLSTAFFIAAGGTPVGTGVADFDNDGYSDIAFTVMSSIDYMAIYRNTGAYRISNSQFVSGQSFNTLDLPGRVYVGDLDVDGKVDILIYYQAGGTNGNMFSVFHNQSSGPGNINFVQHDYTLGAVTGTAGTVGGPSTIADIDGDGKPEIIITSNSTAVANQGFYVFKNNTTPGTINATSFASSGLIPLLGARAVAAADLNFDTKPDLIFTRSGNLLSILENVIAGVPVTITTHPSPNTICSNQTMVLGAVAVGQPGLQYQWQMLSGSAYVNVTDNATYSGSTSSSLTITNPSATTTYRLRATGTYSIAISNPASVTVNPAPAAPSTMGNSGCVGSTLTLNATGGSNGQYRWYTTLSGGSAIAAQTTSSFTTASLSTTTSYFVSVDNGTCESDRVQATATINIVAPPTVSAASRCGSGTLSLSASGSTNGNYRWYDVASGGTALAAAINSTFTTQTLSATATYHVSINNGTCESLRVPVIATINTPPAKPVIATSIAINAGTVSICSGTITLTAPNGFSYLWSTGATTQQITVGAGSFSVQVTDANNCTSTGSDLVQVIVNANVCNAPPVITPEELTASINGSITLDLSTIISDPDNNVDLSSITIVTQPKSGAVATVSNGELQLNYSGVSFSGTDVLTIRVCDFAGSCTTENITIEVVGDIEVFNALSPNGDGLNEFLRLEYIEILDRTKNNKVTILNRWGDVVFEISNYDNTTRVFRGLNNSGSELASGTYFYKIEFSGASAPGMKTGYLSLKR